MRRAFIGVFLFALVMGAMTAEWSSMATAASGVACTKLSANYDKQEMGPFPVVATPQIPAAGGRFLIARPLVRRER
jgi:hypothetical protein